MPEKMAKLIKKDKQVSKSVQQRQAKTADAQRFARQLFAVGKQEAKKAEKANQQNATRRAYGDPLIVDQPEGEYVLYNHNGWSWVNSLFGISEQEVIGGASMAVFAGDNTVYLKNFITAYSCQGWVKGTINGSTITIKFPQPILEAGGEIYYAELLEYSAEQQFYFPVADETLTLSFDPETKAIAANTAAVISGDQIVGLTDIKGEWYGYGNWAYDLTKFDAEVVTAPVGMETFQYCLTADGYAGHLVNVGFTDNEVYVQGIYASLPETWVKGTIADGKVTFKNGTYIGSDTYHQFLVSAIEEVISDPMWGDYSSYTLSDADITFDYDATTKTLSNGSLCLVNAGTNEIYYAVAYKNGSIAPFVETAATPAAPTDLSYENLGYEYYSVYGYGWGYLNYSINPVSADGKFILADKLSHCFYTRIDGVEKVYEFTPDNYAALSEPTTELPYGFTDGWDFYNGTVYLYVTGVDAWGVQTIYRGAGEERRSEITWVETGVAPQPEKETPAYPALDPNNTGNTIGYSNFDGTQELMTLGDGKTETYDIAMKLQDAALVGTHIDKISFPLISAAGITDLKVWLSTNLRVEDGKNAANLVEVPVTATESGMVEVILPTPYTIPEEGVYVGYSLTVNELDDYNATPVAVVAGAKEGGLYMHTSKIYLKWMDMAQEIGASALIELAISGSSVKANSAVAKAGQTQYVLVGNAFDVNTTVVNHGANGIQSLDLEYTVNGQSVEKHFDLDNAIVGQLGLMTIVSAQIPAISTNGDYQLNVKVTKVNGVANEEASVVATTPVIALNSIPKKRALLEEYTGTWCGWCPRGFVALEKLAELYPDDYVLVSYHNGDVMEVLTSDANYGIDEFPSPVAGFPDSWVDRVIEADPYYGLGNYPMGIKDVLDARNSIFGHADIQLAATLGHGHSTVNVATTVTFPFNVADANYGLHYILVADGLTGEGSDWAQGNYYAGEEVTDENLRAFCEGGSSVSGLTFNDVVVKASAVNGKAVEGSIPSTIEADKPISHTYSFNLEEVYNTSYAPIIQDINKLKVVAVLVDNATGEVLNANVVSLGVAKVTLSDAGFATFYDSEKSYKVPSSLKAYVVSDATQGALTYTELNGIIPAGVPALLKSVNQAGGTYTLSAINSKAAYDGPNLLHGSDVATTTTADGSNLYYKLAYGKSDTPQANSFGWFWGAANGAAFQIEGHRAWLAVPAAQGASAYLLTDNAVTGIAETKTVNGISSEAYYDIQGRRISSNMLKKGLYIHNNKKVIVK